MESNEKLSPIHEQSVPCCLHIPVRLRVALQILRATSKQRQELNWFSESLFHRNDKSLAFARNRKRYKLTRQFRNESGDLGPNAQVDRVCRTVHDKGELM